MNNDQTVAKLRYLVVADHVAELIARGALVVGQRIPSVRALSAKLRTSPATVFAAYGELEQRGLVRARPQSGFYVQPALYQPAPEPAARSVADEPTAITTKGALFAMIEESRAPGVVALDAATPDASLVPHAALARGLAAAARRHSGIAASYCYPPGHLALRSAIALRAIDAGVQIVPDDVVVTSGATDGLHLCLRAVTRPGDTVVVESPTYYGILQVLHGLGLNACEVSTSRDGIVIRELERTLARHRIAACFVMPNFANPTGTQMSDRAKAELVKLLARARVPMIEDDVNGELHFGERRPHAAKAHDRTGNVMLCSSVSKTLAPGFRIGWVLPGRWRDRVIQAQWSTTISPSTPSQLAIAEFLRTGGYDRHLRRLRATIEQTMQRASATIARCFPKGTTLTRPAGGLVLWIGLPGRIDARVLQRRALAAGVAIAPGELFAPRPTYRSYFRLNCAVPFTPRIAAAIERLGELSSSS